jgi:hypothetical protein
MSGAPPDMEITAFDKERKSVAKALAPAQWNSTPPTFPRCEVYSRRFLWCCYALRWGINQYDQANKPS